jgi:hypothetical protein
VSKYPNSCPIIQEFRSWNLETWEFNSGATPLQWLQGKLMELYLVQELFSKKKLLKNVMFGSDVLVFSQHVLSLVSIFYFNTITLKREC